jgi:curved DNA-binding protein CbpA
MDHESRADHYETLQISPNAEPETIHRVFRLLAQRFHPDNKDTGNDARFREVTEAYRVLSDPEERARYDLVHERQQRDRWHLVADAADVDTDFRLERRVRLTVLEVLCARRRMEPHSPGIFILDLEKMTGQPREHLQFTVWYLVQKNLIQRSDNSMLVITADGVEYLEANENAKVTQAPRLRAVNS